MNKPKSITQLSKEQLEDLCLNLMHTDKVKTEMLNQLETNMDEAIEYIKHSWRLKLDQIYDTSKCLNGWEAEELLSILERGVSNE